LFQLGEVTADHGRDEVLVEFARIVSEPAHERPVPSSNSAVEACQGAQVRVSGSPGVLDGGYGECPGRVLEGVPVDTGRAGHAGDSCHGGRLPGDRGRLGISGALHDDAQVPGGDGVWRVGSGVGAPVEATEVDAVLDTCDLAVRGEPVTAAGAVVEAVVSVGTQQVKRDGLR